jgi:hypothetical protein
MKYGLYLISFFFLLCGSLVAQQTEEWQDLVKAQKKSANKEVVQAYSVLRSEFPQDASLLNNLGISHVADNNFAEAVLHFETCIRITSNRICKKNLALLRNQQDLVQTSLFVFGFMDGIGNLFSFLSAGTWSIISILLALLFAWISFRKRNLKNWKVILSLLALILSILITYATNCYQDIAGMAVLTAEETNLKDNPHDSAEDIATLYEGQLLKTEKQYDNWYLVTSDTYDNGWISEKEIKFLQKKN